MTPYLAPSLAVLRAEIDRRWPNRDRKSDGWIGDDAHRRRKSDHNPNERGSVDALDVDVDGVDVEAIKAAFERHPSAHYWIHNRQIADRDDGWRRRPYSGPSPHIEHLHGSIRQTRTAEQDTRPWGLLEDDMQLTDPVKLVTGQGVRYSSPTATVGGILASTNFYVLASRNQLLAELAEAKLREEAILRAVTGKDYGEVLAAITAQGEQIRSDLAARSAEDAQRDAQLAELLRKGQAGELDLDAMLRRLGEVIAAGTANPTH